MSFLGNYINHTADSVFGYSFVNGSRKEREMAKSGVETSGHLVKILGKVINIKYSKQRF